MSKFNVRNETLVGALAAVSITLLLLGFNFLKGEDLFTSNSNYHVTYENAMNLQSSSSIIYRGIKVGSVEKIKFQPNGKGVIVSFYVSNKVKIPKGSEAKLITTDLFNTRAIELILADQTELHAEDDTLVGSIAPGLIDQLGDELSPLLSEVQKTVEHINRISASIDGDKLQKTMTNIEATTASLSQMTGDKNSKFNRILADVASITKNIQDNNKLISAALANVHAITDSLAKAELTSTIAQAREALTQTAAVMEKINKGEGSIGLMVNDKALYENLQKSSEDLDKLLIDMKSNPNRYLHFSVFGRKQK
ncbi:MAG: MlaD family protein [Sphingobacteriaceae bacterium]|nr:MlaD family protein [Sphingobacteriaceae bacterium]